MNYDWFTLYRSYFIVHTSSLLFNLKKIITMCPQGRKVRRIGSTESFADKVQGMDYMLLGSVIGGGVGSAMVVNPLCKQLFSKDAAKAEKYAPMIKAGLGLAGLIFSENEYVQAAGLGALAVGGMETLYAWKPDVFKPKSIRQLYAGSAASDRANPEGSQGVGEVINLNQWAVGSYGGGYGYDGAVAGGNYDGAVASL
jgi:hypothetical protein